VKTFNVSTAAAFVIAGAGLPVAKHGSRAATSNSGSADVLQALGVNVSAEREVSEKCLNEIGICFMFAPLHHAATKRVAQVRRDLGVRTIFNLLGPLTNPAGAPFQVVGVSNESACQKVAGALSRLGTKRAWIVRGEDGLDEITLAGKTTVFESSADGVRRFEIAPEDFGLTRTSLDDLRGDSAEENAQTICAVLSGVRQDAARDLVLLNAAASIYIAGGAANFAEAMAAARMVINNGTAMAKLRALQSLSHRSCGSI
jgi:anthranilate phosphoribosyltransferase